MMEDGPKTSACGPANFWNLTYDNNTGTRMIKTTRLHRLTGAFSYTQRAEAKPYWNMHVSIAYLTFPYCGTVLSIVRSTTTPLKARSAVLSDTT
ncbi:hypothetical protein IAQ61_005042 [Plenodomus lingam]|uniref:uncharacterized protein n=1 Tax=Leptosphaeria maculans TaxID=5022 RepID=UPI00331CADAA|nr:hypothetical protein IAQ61_005042 [Plenodomus lingam]